MFKDKVIKTFKPYFELESQRNTYKSDKIDFRIIEFHTICHNTTQNKRKVYAQKDSVIFDSNDFFVNAYDKIAQEFTIEFHQKSINLPPPQHLRYT